MPAFQISVPAQQKLPVFDELKGLAILLIVLYHAGGVLVWNNYLHGDAGVDVFLLLSGFGLALNEKPESARSFFSRRLMRLFPAYWVALTLFLIGNTVFLQLNYSAGNIVTHYLGIHALWGDQYALAINDSFWFISAILLCYIGYWLLRPTLARLDRFLSWAGLISAATALGLYFGGQSGLMGHVGLRLPSFFVGVVAGFLYKHGTITLDASWWSGVGLLLLGYAPYTRGITFYSVFVGIALIAAYCWAVRPRLAETGPAVAVLSFLGRHSLEIFLLHQPLMRDYNYYLHGRWLNEPSPTVFSLCVGMIIALVVTLIVSVELRRLQRVVFGK